LKTPPGWNAPTVARDPKPQFPRGGDGGRQVKNELIASFAANNIPLVAGGQLIASFVKGPRLLYPVCIW
jgi:hypothetical protein